jgi:hypothetical protein
MRILRKKENTEREREYLERKRILREKENT